MARFDKCEQDIVDIRRIVTNLLVENRTDVDLAVSVEHRANNIVLVLTRRDGLSAAGLIIPRGTINGRPISS